MNGSSLQSRRILSARRIALLATTIAGLGGAALLLAPDMVAETPIRSSDRRRRRI